MDNLTAVVMLHRFLAWLEEEGMLHKQGQSKTDILERFANINESYEDRDAQQERMMQDGMMGGR